MFHILSSISLSRQSCWKEFINSSKAALLSSTAMPSIGGGSHVHSLYCRMAPDPSDPTRPLSSLCLRTQQNQTILWMGSSRGPNEPKWRLGRWDQWPISYRLHTWTPIKVFSFWLNWEGGRVGLWGPGGERAEVKILEEMICLSGSLWHHLLRCIGKVVGREAKIWKPCLLRPGSCSSGPRWQVGYWVSEGRGLSLRLWNTLWLQQFGVAWREHGTRRHSGKPRTQRLWRAAFSPRSGGSRHNRCWTELWGRSCPQWVRTAPWAPGRQPSRLGEGGGGGLERFNSLLIRELQGQGNSGINIIMALFYMCRLVRPVCSWSSWVQTPNSRVKAGWLRSTSFRPWNQSWLISTPFDLKS